MLFALLQLGFPRTTTLINEQEQRLLIGSRSRYLISIGTAVVEYAKINCSLLLTIDTSFTFNVQCIPLNVISLLRIQYSIMKLSRGNPVNLETSH